VILLPFVGARFIGPKTGLSLLDGCFMPSPVERIKDVINTGGVLVASREVGAQA
jgi:hypothetical protein